jgi:hypothetical protein
LMLNGPFLRTLLCPFNKQRETFEKYEFLFEFEKGEVFNHMNTLGILRIKN